MEPLHFTNRLTGDNLTPQSTRNSPNRDLRQCDSNHALQRRLIGARHQRRASNNRRESEMFLRGTIPVVDNHSRSTWPTVPSCQSRKWNDSYHHNACHTTAHLSSLCIAQFHWYCSVGQLPSSSRIWALVNSNFCDPRACQVNPARAIVYFEWNLSHCRSWWIVTSYPSGFLRFDSPVSVSQHHVLLVVNYDNTAGQLDSRVIVFFGWISCWLKSFTSKIGPESWNRNTCYCLLIVIVQCVNTKLD